MRSSPTATRFNIASSLALRLLTDARKTLQRMVFAKLASYM